MSRADAVVAFYDDQLDFTFSVARDMGPMVQLWPGLILVTGPAEVDAILRSRDGEFIVARNILDRPNELEKGSARRARWQQLRRAASAAMTPTSIADHMRWVTWRTEQMAGEWLACGRVGDLKEAVTPLVGESMVRYCFGTREIGPQLLAAVLRTERALFRVFEAIIDWPAVVRALLPREWAARRALRDIERRLLAAMAAGGEGGMVDRLRRDSGLSDRELIPIVRATLLAAQGMPAAALAWALVELARNPDEQDAAARALDECDGGSEVPKQVEWIADETLRMWPSGFVGRRATRDVDCAGWTVPAKAEVMVPLWALHRLAPCFDEPDAFRSARWRSASPKLGEYIPFGGGTNRCFGARFGHAQMCAVLATLIRRCRFTLVGEVRPADPLTVLRPAHCELIVERR